ncbi:MAG: phosphatase PAP2 family protein [Oscillospiraceae bacterium]|nr:phosphatase PAP2 family protein [Oscillospiraceae bacterium]
MSAAALWLDGTFHAFDYAVLAWFHALAARFGSVLTPLANGISLTGRNGLLFIAIGLALLCFRRTRRTGVCALLALGLGALFVNLLLKPLVARTRPWEASELLRQWWLCTGAAVETDFSFPSGHVNAAAAFSTAVTLEGGKLRGILPAAFYVLLMCASRCYLTVHYPSDVLAGLLCGLLAGALAFLLVRAFARRTGNHCI